MPNGQFARSVSIRLWDNSPFNASMYSKITQNFHIRSFVFQTCLKNSANAILVFFILRIQFYSRFLKQKQTILEKFSIIFFHQTTRKSILVQISNCLNIPLEYLESFKAATCAKV